MASRKPYSEVVIVASDKDQSRDRVLRAIKFGIENGPLSAHAKIYKDVIELDNRSTIQAMPADWQGAAGGNYSCVIFDELHSWIYENQRRLFDELVIPPTQPEGVRWIASYAGWEGESLLLREWWNLALAGERISDELPIYINQAASLLAFVDTGPESWRMPWMTQEYIEQTKASERANTFRRIWLNEWVSNESQFLPDGAWDACFSPDLKPIGLGENRRLVLGADASTSRDFTALIGAEYNHDLNTTDIRFIRVWKPQRGLFRLGKPTIDLSQSIGAEVMRLHKAKQIETVICDPYQLHNLIVEWEKVGIKVIELPQTTGRVEADQALYDAILGRAVRHYNEPILNEHIKNAIAIETPRGFRIAKEKTSLKIDAAVALSMAHYGVIETQKAFGQIEIMPNIFFEYSNINPAKQLLKIQNNWVIVPDKNTKHHPPGVTWRNCRYRMKGCEACVSEMEADGVYKMQDEELRLSLARGAGIALSEDEANKNLFIHSEWKQMEENRRQNDYKILKNFWANVAGRIGKNKGDA